VFSLDNLQNLVKEFFLKKDQVISVQLYGSFAKGTNTVDSDVDLAIFCDVKNMPNKMDLLSWIQELSELLRKEVDLICLNDASPILGMQVAQDKINILMKDEQAYGAYVMNLYSDYAELKMLRAPMEQGGVAPYKTGKHFIANEWPWETRCRQTSPFWNWNRQGKTRGKFRQNTPFSL